MTKITKKQSAEFQKQCVAMLKSELGAFEITGAHHNYDLGIKTALGTLFLRVDDDNAHCYSVFGNFIGNEKTAEEKYGHWKQNCHLTSELSVPEAIDEVKQYYKKYLI